MYDLKGKRAVVTAASSGIGEAVARTLFQSGSDVLISSSNSERIADAAKRMSGESGRSVIWKTCDMKNPDESSALADYAVEKMGSVDFLIVNYGDPKLTAFMNLTDQDWNDSINMFINSTVRLVRKVVPSMKEGGRVIFITSITTRQAAENFSLSGSLRAAVVNLGKILSLELAPRGITVNSISQGFFMTKRMENILHWNAERKGTSVEAELEVMRNQVPVKRIGKPEEIGYLVRFLCSSEAAYINGANIPIDGGRSLFPY